MAVGGKHGLDGVKARIIGSLLKWHGLGSETNVRESTKWIP